MSIAFAHQIPESLIRGLFDSDRRSGGIPALPLENRDLAITWLRRVLVDFEALDQHIALLQQHYGSSFQYPRPRRDRWDIEQPVDPPTNSAFSHAERLVDDQIATILDKGIDELGDDQISSLLLNPYALFDLFDVIDDVQPEYWLDAIHDLVATQPRTRRTWPPFIETKSRPENATTHAQHATSIDDSSKDLRHSLDSALVISKQLSEVLVREAPSRRSRALQYAMALAACVALAVSVAATWIAINSLNRGAEASREIAQLQRDQSPSSSLQLQSGTLNRITSWEEIWTNNVSATDSDKKNLDRVRLAAPRDLADLIARMESNGRTESEIMTCLRYLLETPQTTKKHK